MAETDTPADSPAEGSVQGPPPGKQKKSRAGRNLPAAIAVGAALAFHDRRDPDLGPVPAGFCWSRSPCPLATHEVVRRLREAGYVIPVIPLLVGGQLMIWLTWHFHAAGALAGFGVTAVVCMFWRLALQRSRAAGIGTIRRGELSARRRGHGLSGRLGAAVRAFGVLLVYPPNGSGRVFCLMIGVVCSDVGGYAVGVLFGKHPMVPSISPNKSWEGLAGSLLFGITAATLAATLLAHKPVWIGLLLGLTIVATATLGDLVESQIKRDLGIKDMGRILPGHGGLMDRLDGTLPSAVATWTVLTLSALRSASA